MTRREERILKIEKYYEKSKENFYIDRNKNIEEIQKFAKGIEELDPAYVDFEYPEITPENLLPSLFKDEFNEEDYKKESEELIKIYNKFEAVQDRLIEEAEKLMGI